MKSNKINFSATALNRDYRHNIEKLRKEIFEIIDYWLMPKFQKNFIEDANFKRETEKAVMFEVIFENLAKDRKKIAVWIPKSMLDDQGNPQEWFWNKKIEEAKEKLTDNTRTIVDYEVVDNPNFETFKSEKQLKFEQEKLAKRQENFAKANLYREKLVKELKDKGYTRAHMKMKTSTLEAEARKRGIDFESLKDTNKNKIENEIKVGDFVNHKNFNDMQNMQVLEVLDDDVIVSYKNAKTKIKKDNLKKAIKLEAYSVDDNFNDRLDKVTNNILKIADFEAKRIAANFVNSLINNVDSKFKSNLGINLTNLDFKQDDLETIELMLKNNINLIKSIPKDILDDLNNLIYESSLGADIKTLEKGLSTIKKISKNRVKTIARDQTAKALNAVSSLRSQQAGFEYYEWITAQDERVSTGAGGHKQLQGKIFRYDTAEAIIDSYGNKGHPAQRVNCRCVAAPIFVNIDEKIEKDKIGYKITKI